MREQAAGEGGWCAVQSFVFSVKVYRFRLNRKLKEAHWSCNVARGISKSGRHKICVGGDARWANKLEGHATAVLPRQT